MFRFPVILLLAMCAFGAAAQVCDPNGNLFLFSNYDGGIVTINVDQNIPDLVIGISTYEPVQVTITGPFAGNVTQVLYAGMNSSQNNNNCGQGNFTTTISGVDPGIVTINPPMEPPQVGFSPAHNNGTGSWGGVVIGAAGGCDTTVNTGGVNTPDELVFHFEVQTGASLYAHYTQSGCWQNAVLDISDGGTCCIDVSPPVVSGCDPNANVMLYSNYEGGTITINVDQNIPDLRIGICTYEAVQVNIIGPFATNVTEVIYAGFDGTNGPCATNPPTTTINGVAPGIVTLYSETLGNIAIANFLGEPLAPGAPPLVNCITGAEGECSTSNSGGGNSAPQIAQFFLAEFGPGATLFGHQVQYNCFNSTFNLSDGGNCCLTETGTPPNPIYAGNATYDFIPWTDSLLCNGPITIDLSFYPVLFQPPIYPGYVWSDGTTGPVITITEPGTYSFIVGDYCHTENGSWLTDTVVVLPCCAIGSVDTSTTTISCSGASDGSITVTPLASGPFSFTWNTVPQQVTPTISGLIAGTYTVVVDDGAGCDTTITFTLNGPDPLSVDVTGTTPLCAGSGGSATALASGGSGGYTYTWSTGASGASIVLSLFSSTVLIGTATDGNGCLASDTLQVVVEQPPVASFTSSADTVCVGALVEFSSTAQGADSLSWSLGTGGSSSDAVAVAIFSSSATEVITLTAYGPNGCASETATDTVFVAPNPQLDLVAAQVPCSRSISVALLVQDADACALWLDGSLISDGCATQLVLPAVDEGDRTITLFASNEAGCADTLTTVVQVADAIGLFVPNVFTPDGDGINDVFSITLGNTAPGSVMRIFNRWGQEVSTTTDLSAGWDGKVGGEPVPDGVYLYVITAPDPCTSRGSVELRGHVTVLR